MAETNYSLDEYQERLEACGGVIKTTGYLNNPNRKKSRYRGSLVSNSLFSLLYTFLVTYKRKKERKNALIKYYTNIFIKHMRLHLYIIFYIFASRSDMGETNEQMAS